MAAALAVAGLAQEFLNAVGNEQRFVFAVGRLVVTDERATLPVGPELLALAAQVVGDDGAGCLQNHLCRAVVLLEADDLRVGKVLFEFEDVADVGAAPGIDALVLVAYGADVLVLTGEELHQLVLRAIGVLVLVDEQVTIAALVAFACFG